ncbi:hypothetical protein BD289DRAFT_90214 [Coniella lustricola]|uniref:Uncharacterized protein n=1 Tax=Coniella lustricola TaxID=2025994 RepID=A0A2T3AGY3_9PEZI|nr:hypothetical protein BD289DRAFT_90214 [Coniella lustricola]
MTLSGGVYTLNRVLLLINAFPALFYAFTVAVRCLGFGQRLEFIALFYCCCCFETCIENSFPVFCPHSVPNRALCFCNSVSESRGLLQRLILGGG